MYTISINTEVPQIESRPDTPEHLDHDYWCMFCDVYYLAYGVMPLYNEELYDSDQEMRYIVIRLLENGYTPKIEYTGHETESVDTDDLSEIESSASDEEYIHDVDLSTSDEEYVPAIGVTEEPLANLN
jgi:hypothetical protein